MSKGLPMHDWLVAEKLFKTFIRAQSKHF